MKRTGPTNPFVNKLAQALKKQSSLNQLNLWKRIAKDLESSSRQRRIVNISRINRHTKPNETVIVPGKVLGSGSLNHALIIAALSFSENARKRIELAKGKCLTIQELIEKNKEGKNIKIIG